MSRLKLLPLIAVVAALLLLGVPAAAQGNGVIQGQLVNRTAPPGGASVANVKVTLQTTVGGVDKGSIDTTTDNDGKFQFTGLNTDPTCSYYVQVSYQTADYASDTVTFNVGETTQAIGVDVFDATDKADKLSFHACQMEIYPGQGRLEIIERYLVTNEGDTTYIGTLPIPGDSQGRKSTLSFSLPPETDQSTLQYGDTLMGCCVVIGSGSLQDTMAVLPGQKVIAFTYQVPFKSSGYTFSKTFAYPVANLAVLVESRGAKASSDTLAGGQPVQYNNTSYLQYTGKNIAANTSVGLKLSGLAGSGGSPLKWGIIAAVMLALGVGLWYPLSRRHKAPAAAQAQAVASGEREELLTTLAKLDDDYEAGLLGEAEYNARRAQVKQRLIDLSRQTERQSNT